MKNIEVKKVNLFQKSVLIAAATLDKLLNNNVNTETIVTSKGTKIRIIEESPGVTIVLVDDIMILV